MMIFFSLTAVAHTRIRDCLHKIEAHSWHRIASSALEWGKGYGSDMDDDTQSNGWHEAKMLLT